VIFFRSPKFVLLIILASVGFAQAVDTQVSEEEDHLRSVLSETNGSPLEMLRAFELHLKKFPKSAKRADIEKAAAKSAMELKDDRRIIEYGERVLERESDLQILDRVSSALLSTDRITPSMAERALKYAKQFEELVLQISKEPLTNVRDAARRKDEIDRGISRSLVFQSRALSALNKNDEAVATARKAFEWNPSEIAGHVLGRALTKAQKPEDAAKAFVDAFTVPDPRATDADRELDRKLMVENWRQAKGSEAGLGDLILPAYDRNLTLVQQKRKALRDIDPNRDTTNPMEFTLSGMNGDRLDLKSLRGKVVVLDFWATWCGPCRGQYPLYEEVKKKFKDRKDVVFLAINTDEDHGLVKPFLDAQKWNKNVYFEDGLSRLLRVENIPATMVFDKQGQLVSRMNGYVPERFVDMLSSRIDEALEAGANVIEHKK
jgi:thiol-disulfide isomerase/thioredoxin